MRTILTALILCGGLGGPAMAADAPEGGAWTDCTVASIAAFRDHLVVRCATPAVSLQGGAEPGLREFALEATGPLSDPVLRLAMAAKSGGRPLAVLYVRDQAANPVGCLADRCRRIAGVELK